MNEEVKTCPENCLCRQWGVSHHDMLIGMAIGETIDPFDFGDN